MAAQETGLDEVEGFLFSRSTKPWISPPTIGSGGVVAVVCLVSAVAVGASILIRLLPSNQDIVISAGLALTAVLTIILVSRGARERGPRTSSGSLPPIHCVVSQRGGAVVRAHGELEIIGSWLVFRSDAFSFRIQPKDIKGGRPPRAIGTEMGAILNLPGSFPVVRVRLVALFQKHAPKRQLKRELLEWESSTSLEEDSIWPPLVPFPDLRETKVAMLRAIAASPILTLGMCMSIYAIEPLLPSGIPSGAVKSLLLVLATGCSAFFALVLCAVPIYEHFYYKSRQNLHWSPSGSSKSSLSCGFLPE